ncbi:neprilysin-1-like [Drosophila gunungcola]|uniref:Membrane metallo-endopeptidase-like 1 n=1 Tax=Drosophila gunungcola TaxID=103775 RepID=A0A9P9YJZ9_9MUSC|nr:neprilysin-1-like [Drosophila gunungcola]KAI8038266.1 hypothetical protein M5D96_008956 [Drosophila gunungcola]
MERIVWISSLLLLLGFATGLGVTRSVDATANERILSSIKRHMNDSADPCEDFQNYATGKFHEVNKKEDWEITQDAIRDSYIGKLQSVLDLLKDRLFVDEFSVEEKVWRFYNTCLTAPEGTSRIRRFLELVPPGENLTWPPLVAQGSQWPKQQFQWLETLANLRLYALENPLIFFEIRADFYSSNKFSLALSKPDLYKLSNVSEVEDLLKRTGVGPRRAVYLARSIIQLDSDLNGPTGVDTFYTFTLEDVQSRTNLQMGKYLQTVFGHSFENSTSVYVSNMEYFEQIDGVVRKYDSEVVASYLMIQFVRFLLFLDGNGPEKKPAQCAAAVASQMELASDLLYENHYLGQGKREEYSREVQRIFEAVSRTLMARLEENRMHLTDDEVNFLQQKLLAKTLKVGYLPDGVNHRRFVTNFYDDLELDTHPDFARAQLSVLRHRQRRFLDKFNGPVAKGTDYLYFSGYISDNVPGIWFDDSHNIIVMPYNMLLEPYFAPESHDVFKMSLLGFYLARTMMKSFLPGDLPFDSVGNYGGYLNEFKERQSYVDGLACLNSTARSKDLHYRSGDVVSLGLVYETFFGGNSVFNQDQPAFADVPLKKLFLLNVAQLFSFTQEYQDEVQMDSDKLRLSQAVSNLPAFCEIFNCPDTAPLNPPRKCEMW